MFGIDVGYHGDGRQEFQERPIAFIRFRHQEVSLPQFGTAPDAVKFSTGDDCGIQAAMGQNGGDQGGSGSLSVGSGNGHAVLHSHELCQHLCSWNDGNELFNGCLDLRITLLDGRGDDDDL